MESASQENPSHPDDRKTPPAFLDLADTAPRNGSGLDSIVQQKRLEHERQRFLQRSKFEELMRNLEEQHAKEEKELLGIPSEMHHLAVSAPTTPPRIGGQLSVDQHSRLPNTVYEQQLHFPHGALESLGPYAAQQFAAAGISHGPQVTAASTVADKRKSVTYGPTTDFPRSSNASPAFQSSSNYIGAKSMPASRRGSPGAREGDDLVRGLQALAIQEGAGNGPVNVTGGIPPKPILRQTRTTSRFGEGQEYPNYNAALLDDELNKDINNTIKFLPADSDEGARHDNAFKLSASSAALDLAPLSHTSPRTSFMNRIYEAGQKSSEWPAYSSGNRIDRRGNTIPGLSSAADITTKLGSTASTPLNQTHSPVASRRSSPRGFGASDNIIGNLNARSVPATPLGPTGAGPILPNKQGSTGTPSLHGQEFGGEYGRYDSTMPFGLNEDQFGLDSPYGLGGQGIDHRFSNGFNNYDNHGGRLYQQGRYPGSGGGAGGASARGGFGGGGGGGADRHLNGAGLHANAKHKRGDIDREFNRYAGARLEDLIMEIPTMCKDQHGCRYLQKKLEEGNPEHRDIIFRETFNHFPDLMTDPFGNYLCQKLLEYSTDDQRNAICEAVSGDLVTISLNMHGTRAVQKMIDFLSTQRQADNRYGNQIVSIIRALSLHVVTLIKDLNGNHVIQKCLNRLAPEDNQFIYNAVASHCVEVATHRHGCCVLQRCIDHASEAQRIQLVTEITFNALTLVQDPYGNYVVQYILDLNDNRFSDAVIRQFFGNVCALSVQKFSSNVIEKCIRVAEHGTRKLLVEELLNRNRLEKLLRDSFGNYCVQTALDYAEPNQRMLLVEGIRPILPLIRNTPYGKRIQSKIQREHLDHGNSHYGNYHQGPMMNLALHGSGGGGGGGRGPISPMNNDYNRSPMYGLLAGQQPSPLVTHSPGLHNQYSSPHSSQSPGGVNEYLLQNGGISGQGLGLGSYQGLGQYGNGVYAGSGGLGGSPASELYQHQPSRNGFQY